MQGCNASARHFHSNQGTSKKISARLASCWARAGYAAKSSLGERLNGPLGPNAVSTWKCPAKDSNMGNRATTNDAHRLLQTCCILTVAKMYNYRRCKPSIRLVGSHQLCRFSTKLLGTWQGHLLWEQCWHVYDSNLWMLTWPWQWVVWHVLLRNCSHGFVGKWWESVFQYLQTWNKVSLKRGWLLRSTSYDTWAVTLVVTCVCLDCFAWIAWVIAAANVPRKPIEIRELWRGERTGADLFLSWPDATWYCSVDVACCLSASDYSFDLR